TDMTALLPLGREDLRAMLPETSLRYECGSPPPASHAAILPEQPGHAAQRAFFKKFYRGGGVLRDQLVHQLRPAAGEEDPAEALAQTQIRQRLLVLLAHRLEHGGQEVEAVGRQRQVAERRPVRLDLQAVAAQERRVERHARRPPQRFRDGALVILL